MADQSEAHPVEVQLAQERPKTGQSLFARLMFHITLLLAVLCNCKIRVIREKEPVSSGSKNCSTNDHLAAHQERLTILFGANIRVWERKSAFSTHFWINILTLRDNSHLFAIVHLIKMNAFPSGWLPWKHFAFNRSLEVKR